MTLKNIEKYLSLKKGQTMVSKNILETKYALIKTV